MFLFLASILQQPLVQPASQPASHVRPGPSLASLSLSLSQSPPRKETASRCHFFFLTELMFD